MSGIPNWNESTSGVGNLGAPVHKNLTPLEKSRAFYDRFYFQCIVSDQEGMAVSQNKLNEKKLDKESIHESENTGQTASLNTPFTATNTSSTTSQISYPSALIQGHYPAFTGTFQQQLHSTSNFHYQGFENHPLFSNNFNISSTMPASSEWQASFQQSRPVHTGTRSAVRTATKRNRVESQSDEHNQDAKKSSVNQTLHQDAKETLVGLI